MTTAETNAAVRAAADALFPVKESHGLGCPCIACRAWLSLMDAEPEFAELYGRELLRIESLREVRP